MRDNKFWDQVKRFMYKYEPLIELKETMANGEILQWKHRAGWQGSGEHYLSGRPSHGYVPMQHLHHNNINHQILPTPLHNQRHPSWRSADKLLSSRLFK